MYIIIQNINVTFYVIPEKGDKSHSCASGSPLAPAGVLDACRWKPRAMGESVLEIFLLAPYVNIVKIAQDNFQITKNWRQRCVYSAFASTSRRFLHASARQVTAESVLTTRHLALCDPWATPLACAG